MTGPPALDGPRLAPASGGLARQLVVLLHGYGADGTDLIDLAHAFQARLPDAAFVLPHAPEHLPFEALSGRQWFALSERTPHEYQLGAEAAAPRLNHFLDRELDRLSLEDHALALVGFSQGAMMAFQCGLRRPAAPAALIAYSGLLPGAAEMTAGRPGATGKAIPAEGPPVLIVHGCEDDIVPAYHGQMAHKVLTSSGRSCSFHALEGLGHGIDGRGLKLAATFLEQAFARG